MTRRPKAAAKPRRGRPPKADSRTIPRMVRLRPDEAAAHDAASGAQSWADWIRDLANAAAERWRDTLRR